MNEFTISKNKIATRITRILTNCIPWIKNLSTNAKFFSRVFHFIRVTLDKKNPLLFSRGLSV